MDFPHPVQGSQVQSLVGELGSSKPHGRAKKCVYTCSTSQQERVRGPHLVHGPVRFFLALALTLPLSFRQLEV